jgi:hypothetical protein
MKASTYTKIVASSTYNDQTMSLGFRRFFCLPKAAKLNFSMAYYFQTGSTNDHAYAVNFFGAMTEQQYKQYVITH